MSKCYFSNKNQYFFNLPTSQGDRGKPVKMDTKL